MEKATLEYKRFLLNERDIYLEAAKKTKDNHLKDCYYLRSSQYQRCYNFLIEFLEDC